MQQPIAALCALTLLPAGCLWAKRTDDLVVMKNGDRMTGEIKKLENGQLFFKASYMLDSVALDWTNVERLESKDQFNVSLTDGKLHSGAIGKEASAVADAQDFFVLDEGAVVRAKRRDVVTIVPVEHSAWKQLTGSIDYGFSYTGGANAATQSSLSGAVSYRAERWSLDLTGSSVFSSQSQGSSTGRNNFEAFFARKLTERWYVGAVSELLNSEQQDLKIRSTAGGGLGRQLVRTDHSQLGLLSGVMFSRERYTRDDPSTAPESNNAEALFQLKYQMYRFKSPRLEGSAYLYPSLTVPGRYRTGVQSAIKIELFRNFYWKFSIYENFDSRPPVHAPRNDFGTSTSLGWTF